MRVECFSVMGFGTDLQGQASHEALLKLQDTEMQLLECIKKCVTLRIRSDREYTSALSAMLTHSQKFDTSKYDSPIFQVSVSTLPSPKGCLIHPDLKVKFTQYYYSCHHSWCPFHYPWVMLLHIYYSRCLLDNISHVVGMAGACTTDREHSLRRVG